MHFACMLSVVFALYVSAPRVLRAVRFSADLGCSLSPQLEAEARRMAHRCQFDTHAGGWPGRQVGGGRWAGGQVGGGGGVAGGRMTGCRLVCAGASPCFAA